MIEPPNSTRKADATNARQQRSEIDRVELNIEIDQTSIQKSLSLEIGLQTAL